MLALALHYLNGWAMAAADGASKQIAEWPPHPDRVFMALAAAHFETDGADQAAERATLEWLERLPPPELAVSDAEYRRVVTHYVPVNDTGLARSKKIAELAGAPSASFKALRTAGLDQLPELRPRQARAFPVAIPHNPVAHLIWPDTEPTDDQRDTLARLCRKVTHVGHSASFVQMWLDETPPPASWIPTVGIAKHRLRIPSDGRLAYLEARVARDRAVRFADQQGTIADLKRRMKMTKGKEKKALASELLACEEALRAEYPAGAPVSLRPEPGLWQGYDAPLAAAPAETPGSLFDPNLVVLRLSGSRLSLRATLRLMAIVRGAVMAKCPQQPPPEWLAGHTPDGQPTRAPHLAFLPLPFVGRPHADGRIMGAALALPKGLDPDEAAACLADLLYDQHGLPRAIPLFDGHWLDGTAELETRTPAPQESLRTRAWTGPARRWASVTPVVLDRHFDGPDKWQRAADSVKTACERIGLPRPADVLLHPVSLFEGVPRSNEFPPITRKRDGGRMHHSHTLILFDEPVSGPVLVGAGRFRGYGLCRPFVQGGDDHV
ncbi:type I-U CRISPR-associated protein Csb2 [Thiococcus pfennigii]|uniref:type I-G CRISPR-associated protein Csb2 n=1 Tax=Thiococcus pfennigii TaxID=1057 RepID=UPI0019040167|nr:type I-U CRISPR-associated protein Csb2 [Thiococcus pfennigii]MBK1731103.1 type I-U CRISPR-associated protein Cas5/Cas6 [Thiococcus pfennigii]